MEKIEEKKKILESLFSKLGIPLKYLNHQSKLCLHPNGCIENILKGAMTSFKYGYLIRMVISFVGALLQLKKDRKNVMLLPKSLIVKENWIFAIFLALFPLINKSILCGLRAYRGKNNGKQDFIAGAIAGGISVSILPSSLRFLLNLYLMTRALEALYRHYLSTKGINRSMKYDYILIFAFSCGFIGYAFSFEPDLMPPGLVKIYLRFANMDKNDQIFREAWIEMGKRKLQGK